MEIPNDTRLKTGEAARYLGLSEDQVRYLIRRGRLPAGVAENGQYFILAGDVEEHRRKIQAAFAALDAARTPR